MTELQERMYEQFSRLDVLDHSSLCVECKGVEPAELRSLALELFVLCGEPEIDEECARTYLGGVCEDWLEKAMDFAQRKRKPIKITLFALTPARGVEWHELYVRPNGTVLQTDKTDERTVRKTAHNRVRFPPRPVRVENHAKKRRI